MTNVLFIMGAYDIALWGSLWILCHIRDSTRPLTQTGVTMGTFCLGVWCLMTAIIIDIKLHYPCIVLPVKYSWYLGNMALALDFGKKIYLFIFA